MNLDKILLEQIASLSTLNDELNRIMELIIADKRNDMMIANKFIFLLNKYQGNQVIIKSFADFLRIANDEVYFDIKNLTNLYEKMSVLNPWDIDSEAEHYFYLENVMGEPEQAKEILDGLNKRIRRKKKEIKDSQKGF